MRFLGKYELLEQVASGNVEVFMARDSLSREPTVVYVFPISDKPEYASPVQYAMQCFLKLAPLPIATMIDGGSHEAGSGYLVSKLDQSSLRNWIEAYKLQVAGGEPGPIAPTEVLETDKPAPMGLSPGEPSSHPSGPGEFTRQFMQNAYPELNPPAPAPSVEMGIASGPRAARQPRNPAGIFTSQFLASLQSGAEVEKKPVQSEAADRKFRDQAAAEIGPRADTGEFNKFFEASFESEPSITDRFKEEPNSLPRRKGDFTSLFGPAVSASLAESPAASFPESAPRKPGAFTRIFGEQADTATSDLHQANTSDMPVLPEIAAPNRESSPAAPASAFQGSSGSGANEVAADSRLHPYGDAMAAKPSKQAATQLFKSGESRPAEALPFPSGRSDYTRIIQGPERTSEPVPAVAPSPPVLPPTAGAVPAAAVPVMPMGTWPVQPPPPAAVPPATPAAPMQFQPAPVQYPQMPAATMPMPPAMNVPPASPAPQPAVASGAPRFAYWPLIIGLNVLFVIAVLLVLYFALKK